MTTSIDGLAQQLRSVRIVNLPPAGEKPKPDASAPFGGPKQMPQDRSGQGQASGSMRPLIPTPPAVKAPPAAAPGNVKGSGSAGNKPVVDLDPTEVTGMDARGMAPLDHGSSTTPMTPGMAPASTMPSASVIAPPVTMIPQNLGPLIPGRQPTYLEWSPVGQTGNAAVLRRSSPTPRSREEMESLDVSQSPLGWIRSSEGHFTVLIPRHPRLEKFNALVPLEAREDSGQGHLRGHDVNKSLSN